MIKLWHIKAIVQKTISFIPFKEKANYFFQKHITKGVELSEQYFGDKIQHAKDHIFYFDKLNKENFDKKHVLELGTGWYPIIPISLFLCGYENIITVDSQNWLNKETLKISIDRFLKLNKKGTLKTFLPFIKEEKIHELSLLSNSLNNTTLENSLKKLSIEYKIGDINHMNIQEKSVNYICSNNTFEHIDKENLKNILLLFKKLITNKGIMSHFIDMSDHFAHYDKTITIYNFLKYSNSLWKTIDNSIQPQNRMRFIDFKQMYKEINIGIDIEDYRKGNIEEVKNIKLDSHFKQYSFEDLAISHTYLITKC